MVPLKGYDLYSSLTLEREKTSLGGEEGSPGVCWGRTRGLIPGRAIPGLIELKSMVVALDKGYEQFVLLAIYSLCLPLKIQLCCGDSKLGNVI